MTPGVTMYLGFPKECVLAGRIEEDESAHVGGISSLVVADLEAQKIVNSLAGFAICGRYPDDRALRRLFKLIVNLVAQPDHGGHTRRGCIVNEHGHVKVTRGKFLLDVGQMHADLIAAFQVGRIIGGHFDRST